jgi:glycosyltransferase involved in cell wall biosynthesis
MPPIRSGVAACSLDLVRALSTSYDIDVFVGSPVELGTTCGNAPAVPAHDFVWRNRQRPYGLAVYQLGNSACHEYMWPYLFRFPGLAVLHDARLHHARAAALLRAARAGDYRMEFAAAHPDVSRDLAELAIKGFDSQLYYDWPMTRLIARTSAIVAVHGRVIAEELRQENPAARIETIRLGHGRSTPLLETREAARTRLGIAEDATVFGCFGGLSPEKRISQVLQAFAWLRSHVPNVHLLLAGAASSEDALRTDVHRLGVGDVTTVTGYLERDDELDACIEAADVALTLRWPTAREISGPWLRCLSLGKPTVTMQLRHLADVPALDPRDWQPIGSPGIAGSLDAGNDPVTVAIDLWDEDHSLRLAMRRLATDAALRRSLGRAGRRYWSVHHSVEGMVDDYRRLIPLAAAQRQKPGDLPSHLINDGDRRLRTLLAPFGVADPLR